MYNNWVTFYRKVKNQMEILGLTSRELKETLSSEFNVERWRSRQIFDWIYKKGTLSFSSMTNLSKPLRSLLENFFEFPSMKIIRKSESVDGTCKYLISLEDSNSVEAVVIPHINRKTFCISSQVGCPVGCAFCWTGRMGFIRNLRVSEIIGQILLVQEDLKQHIGNVVFMGMGEPFLNFDNVMKAVYIMNDKDGLAIGARRITLSTVGIPEKIIKFSRFPLQVRLAVSLHAPTSEKRKKIVPLDIQYPLEKVLAASREYVINTNRRITIEYVLIKGFNESLKDADNLSKILKGLKCNVNLIPVNENPAGFEKPDDRQVSAFAEELKRNGIEAVVRIERGTDIRGACGQLKNEKQVIITETQGK